MPPKTRNNPLARFLADLDELDTDDALSTRDLARAYGLDLPAHPYEASSTRKDSPPPSKKQKTTDSRAACEAEKCSAIPRCLNWLGQQKWQKKNKAVRDLQKAAKLDYDPHDDERDVTKPVGLKNLGATCFMNSFLQVWFQHPALRQGVFACQVDKEDAESSPVYQLQVIFAALQDGQLGVYNPKPLVTALKLDMTEQQDAQEFAKLFMSLLDHAFEAQAEPRVRTLMKDLFEGKLSYLTTCSRCHAQVERDDDFTELTLTLKPNCQLADCIARSLADEQFSGDNQYFCGSCASNQDAVRSTHIKKLPAVLHFSLLRFVYDLKLGDRKKTTHNISIPRVLDMSDYLPGSSEIYDLRGVLLHKGKSAHHGHYVAQVYDTTFKRWYTFDDEDVQPLEKFESKSKEDDKDEAEAQKGKKNKSKKVVPDSEDETEDDIEIVPTPPKSIDKPSSKKAVDDSLIKTADAYMLIYVRREADGSPAEAEPVKLPERLQAAIDELANDLGKRIEEFDAKNKEIVKQFDEARARKEKVWQSWTADELDEDAYFVDKAALTNWISEGLAPTATPKVIDLDGDDKSKPASKAKKEPTPAQSPAAERSASNGAQANGDKPADSMDVDTAASNGHSETPPVAGSSADIETNGTSSVADAGNKVNVLDNTALLCSHGKISIKRPGNIKVISQLGVMALQDLGITLQPLISTADGMCRQCVETAVREHRYEGQHKEDVKSFKAADKGKGRTWWVSQEWIDDWVKPKPALHDSTTGSDLPPDAAAYQRHTVCEHDGLAPSKNLRKAVTESAIRVLVSLFPGFRPRFDGDTEPCSICGPDHAKDDALWEACKAEKQQLADLFKSGRIDGGIAPLMSDTSYILIPRPWLKAWKSWAKSPVKKDRPVSWSTEYMFCEHKKLLRDFTLDQDCYDVVFCTREEAKHLYFIYKDQVEYRIKVNVDAGLNKTTNFDVCHECREARRLDFDTAEVVIRWLTEDDFDSEGNRIYRPVDDDSRATSPKPSRQSSIENFYGKSARRTTRRSTTASASRPKLEKINLERMDTLKDIKLAIQKDCRVPTIYQRLFFKEQELNDLMDTVLSLGIGPGDMIEVYKVPTEDDKVDISDLKDVDTGSRSKKRARNNEGFAGTGLHGFDLQPARSRSKSEEAPLNSDAMVTTDDVPLAPIEGAAKSCPQCTFDNSLAAESCEICAHAFI